MSSDVPLCFPHYLSSPTYSCRVTWRALVLKQYWPRSRRSSGTGYLPTIYHSKHSGNNVTHSLAPYSCILFYFCFIRKRQKTLRTSQVFWSLNRILMILSFFLHLLALCFSSLGLARLFPQTRGTPLFTHILFSYFLTQFNCSFSFLVIIITKIFITSTKRFRRASSSCSSPVLFSGLLGWKAKKTTWKYLYFALKFFPQFGLSALQHAVWAHPRALRATALAVYLLLLRKQ